MQFGLLGFPIRPLLPVAQGVSHRGNDLVAVKRLLKKIGGAELHGFDGKRHIAMPGDDNHRDVDIELRQPFQEVDPARCRACVRR